MNLARKELQEGNYNKTAVDIITAYAAALLLYGNGQRSGVVTNLRIEEFIKRQPCDNDIDKVIIPCLNHKTGPQGIARLVVTREVETLLVHYYNKIRKKIKPRQFINANRFFLTYHGLLYTQVYRRVNNTLCVGKLKLPRPKDYRIVVATDAARELNDADLRRVAKHLSHSPEASRMYYEFSDATDALIAHQKLSGLSKQRKWSKAHTMALLKEWPLTKRPPGLAACRKISKRHHMNRTGKQILDKWRQLHKSL